MFHWLHSYFDKRIIKRFRNEFALLGFPLDHLSDEELMARTISIGRMVTGAGLTVGQVSEGFIRLNHQPKEADY